MKTTCFAIVFALMLITTMASAQTHTTFTYQGELHENGAPANGSFNIDFSLWDVLTSGNQIGSTIMFNALPVVNGKFTVELDFGEGAFDNSERWLEIEVNGGPLSPRTPVTRTPYSIQTRGIVVDENENVGIGTSTPFWELEVANPTAGDSVEIGVTADDNAGALAAYSSTFLFPHFADRVSLFSDAFASTGLDLRADGAASDIRFYAGGIDTTNEMMRITDSGRVGIGESSPLAALHVKPQPATGTTTTFRAVSTSAGGTGIYGEAASHGTGVFGKADLGTGAIGVYGWSTEGDAGRFLGDVHVIGTVSKSAGSFKIDHPLDPSNKYLSHSFVESPDMMNVYNGNIITDADGYATVVLPEWFGVLNRDFRYQLTVIDDANRETFVLVKVVERIKDNQFRIRANAPFTEVSWQVTGIRQDPYAEANRIQVEELKPLELRGLYRHPKLYGKTVEFREESIKIAALLGEEPESTEALEQVAKNPDH